MRPYLFGMLRMHDSVLPPPTLPLTPRGWYWCMAVAPRASKALPTILHQGGGDAWSYVPLRAHCTTVCPHEPFKLHGDNSINIVSWPYLTIKAQLRDHTYTRRYEGTWSYIPCSGKGRDRGALGGRGSAWPYAPRMATTMELHGCNYPAERGGCMTVPGCLRWGYGPHCGSNKASQRPSVAKCLDTASLGTHQESHTLLATPPPPPPPMMSSRLYKSDLYCVISSILPSHLCFLNYLALVSRPLSIYLSWNFPSLCETSLLIIL